MRLNFLRLAVAALSLIFVGQAYAQNSTVAKVDITHPKFSTIQLESKLAQLHRDKTASAACLLGTIATDSTSKTYFEVTNIEIVELGAFRSNNVCQHGAMVFFDHETDGVTSTEAHKREWYPKLQMVMDRRQDLYFGIVVWATRTREEGGKTFYVPRAFWISRN